MDRLGSVLSSFSLILPLPVPKVPCQFFFIDKYEKVAGVEEAHDAPCLFNLKKARVQRRGSTEHVPMQELSVPSSFPFRRGAASAILPTYSIRVSMSLVQGSEASELDAVLKKQLSISSELLGDSVTVLVNW